MAMPGGYVTGTYTVTCHMSILHFYVTSSESDNNPLLIGSW